MWTVGDLGRVVSVAGRLVLVRQSVPVFVASPPDRLRLRNLDVNPVPSEAVGHQGQPGAADGQPVPESRS